ncbi:hypothetical protein SJAG_04566 [Schizosaccharomyces japonicus yFS275]|uniref:AAA+ ATPase domain-containing protein n=1 Tax=Schizosaccharomyces japonicus (strain yFS275 / FY16936) TaxID=402676 RepID=B6K760_SCHJY|nr:hypothetical protein SJAG_04566 [Schizosaccharomyces japonicus yFS275]EEB09364.2 hypothetical protein SJAG_04566 [Schizosaccharomyces japonicus yFS275]
MCLLSPAVCAFLSSPTSFSLLPPYISHLAPPHPTSPHNTLHSPPSILSSTNILALCHIGLYLYSAGGIWCQMSLNIERVLPLASAALNCEGCQDWAGAYVNYCKVIESMRKMARPFDNAGKVPVGGPEAYAWNGLLENCIHKADRLRRLLLEDEMRRQGFQINKVLSKKKSLPRNPSESRILHPLPPQGRSARVLYKNARKAKSELLLPTVHMSPVPRTAADSPGGSSSSRSSAEYDASFAKNAAVSSNSLASIEDPFRNFSISASPAVAIPTATKPTRHAALKGLPSRPLPSVVSVPSRVHSAKSVSTASYPSSLHPPSSSSYSHSSHPRSPPAHERNTPSRPLSSSPSRPSHAHVAPPSVPPPQPPRNYSPSSVAVPTTPLPPIPATTPAPASESPLSDFEAAIMSEIMQPGEPVYWSDIAGLEDAKNSLKEAVIYPFLRPELFCGLREPVQGMLLFGPPGTGKTMLAKAVATEAKATFFSISASSLTSKYLGESEKLVRALFTVAKRQPCSVIFVDEIDSILSSRSDQGNEHESSRRLKTEFLIQWSSITNATVDKNEQQPRVLVLAATNLPWCIDEAARRRFVKRTYIPLPEFDTRYKHLTHLMKNQKHSLSDSDFEELSRLTEGYSGSDITALAKDAAMGPLRSLGDALLTTSVENIPPIDLNHFKNSIKTIRPSVSPEGISRYEEWNAQYGSQR